MHERRRDGSLRLKATAFATRALFVGVAAGVSVGGCKGRAPEASAVDGVPEAPVAPPDGLIAEGRVATPDATWQRLQRGVGGAAGILPSTVGGLACAVAGIDPGLASEIDGASAAYVVVAGDVPAPGWVVAMRLADSRHTRAVVEGETSRVDLRPSGDVQVVTSKGAKGDPRAPRVTVALSRNGWFLLARAEEDLARLGPYATRTLPMRPPAKEAVAFDVPGAALAGALRSRIAGGWSDARTQMLENDRQLRAQHGGRAPDFGDPGAIVARVDASIQSRLAILADLKGAHLGMDAGENDVRVVLTAPPATQGGPASALLATIHPGDVSPLRAVMRDAGLALLIRDTADGRAKDAADLETSIDSALGGRLSPPDAKRVHGAIDDWTSARGDAWTLALVLGADRGVRVDARATDPARLARSVHEGIDVLSHVPAFREPLATWLGVRNVAFGTGDVPGGGHAETATVTLSRAEAPPFALAWTKGNDDVTIALSEKPLPLLAPSTAGHTLGDDPALRALMDALGDVAGALVLQAGRTPSCIGDPGGIALAWGRRDVNGSAAIWGEAAASDSALRCLGKSAF